MTLGETGDNTETDKQFIYNTYTDLLETADARSGMTKTEAYDERAKALFVNQPANMKLLVVVDRRSYPLSPAAGLGSGVRPK
jgi:type I restriction enzyme R subunit